MKICSISLSLSHEAKRINKKITNPSKFWNCFILTGNDKLNRRKRDRKKKNRKQFIPFNSMCIFVIVVFHEESVKIWTTRQNWNNERKMREKKIILFLTWPHHRHLDYLFILRLFIYIEECLKRIDERIPSSVFVSVYKMQYALI